jgi:hypothetical protein
MLMRPHAYFTSSVGRKENPEDTIEIEELVQQQGARNRRSYIALSSSSYIIKRQASY